MLILVTDNPDAVAAVAMPSCLHDCPLFRGGYMFSRWITTRHEASFDPLFPLQILVFGHDLSVEGWYLPLQMFTIMCHPNSL